MIIAPFFHTFGYKAGWVACLLRGATIVPQITSSMLDRRARDRSSATA